MLCVMMNTQKKQCSELHRQTNVYAATDVNVTVTADYSDSDIMVMLSRITNSASGSDDLPFWLYRECATELSHVLSKLINSSINKGEVLRHRRIHMGLGGPDPP